MNPTRAKNKAFEEAKALARKTDRPDTFWEQLYKDVERKKRLIELEEVRREFDK